MLPPTTFFLLRLPRLVVVYRHLRIQAILCCYSIAFLFVWYILNLLFTPTSTDPSCDRFAAGVWTYYRSMRPYVLYLSTSCKMSSATSDRAVILLNSFPILVASYIIVLIKRDSNSNLSLSLFLTEVGTRRTAIEWNTVTVINTIILQATYVCSVVYGMWILHMPFDVDEASPRFNKTCTTSYLETCLHSTYVTL